MKHIGTITDRSYYQRYSRIKDNKEYHYRICPICDKEYENGFTYLDSGMTTSALPHNCKTVDDFHPFLTGFERFRIFEWGQFIFKQNI